MSREFCSHAPKTLPGKLIPKFIANIAQMNNDNVDDDDDEGSGY